MSRLDDEALVAGIELSTAATRFLGRRRTRLVIALGLLDGDVVEELERAAERMSGAREARRAEKRRVLEGGA